MKHASRGDGENRMPLKPIKSAKSADAAFHDLRHGNLFRRTKEKHGEEAACRQMVAIVLDKERESGYRKGIKKK